MFRDRCRRPETAPLAAEGFGWWRWHEWLGPDGGTAVWLPGTSLFHRLRLAGWCITGLVGVQGECDRSVGIRRCHPLRPLFANSGVPGLRASIDSLGSR